MSELTHIICAHCGQDNAISNSSYALDTIPKKPVLVVELGGLYFHCQHCRISYSLPASYGG